MQRANARTQQSTPPPLPQYDDEADYQPDPVHPLHRHGQSAAAAPPQAHHQYQDEQQYAEDAEEADPSRYDDALYGQIESAQDYQRDPAYPDDPYAYQGGYDEEPEERPRRRGGMFGGFAGWVRLSFGTGSS